MRFLLYFHSRPDNLKVLFRPIAMMKPELDIIAQVTLYAGGFENAQTLATKVVTIFKICAELLPPEAYYDFGKSSFYLPILHIKQHLIGAFFPFLHFRFAKHENRFAFVLQTKV